MGWKTEIWGWGRGLETAGGCGTGIVGGVVVGGGSKHSDDFPWVSFIRTTEERETEREKGQESSCCPVTDGNLNHGDTSAFKREGGRCEKIETLTHTHAHTQNILRGPVDTSHSPIKVLTGRRAGSCLIIVFKSTSFFFFFKEWTKRVWNAFSFIELRVFNVCYTFLSIMNIIKLIDGTIWSLAVLTERKNIEIKKN